MSKWEKVRLRDVCEKKINSLPSNYDSDIEYIDISAIDNSRKRITATRILNAKDAPSRAKQLLKIGDILVSTVRPNLNAVAMLKESSDITVVGSTGYCVLRCTSKIIREYVFYFCQSKKFIDGLVKVAKGASYPAVGDNDVKNIEIPLPPLEVQRKNAQTLTAASDLITLRRKQLSELDSLVKSVFNDMFGDPVENPKDWTCMTLPDVASKERHAIKRGPFGGSLKKDIFVNEGCLVYEQYHAIYGDFSHARYFITEEKYKEMIMFKVKPGDLIISCSGTLGKIAEVPKNALPGIINQALLKITLDQTLVNNYYFKILFKQHQIQDKLFNFSRGSGISNFPPMAEVNAIMFPIPPLELQNQFAEIVTKIEEQKALVQKAIDESQNVFDSLMSEYFG